MLCIYMIMQSDLSQIRHLDKLLEDRVLAGLTTYDIGGRMALGTNPFPPPPGASFPQLSRSQALAE